MDTALPWSCGAATRDRLAATAPLVRTARVGVLADPALWGREVDDERYALLADV